MKFDKTLFLTMIMILAATSKLRLKKRARPTIPRFRSLGQERHGLELFNHLANIIEESCKYTDKQIFRMNYQMELAEMNYFLMAKMTYLIHEVIFQKKYYLIKETKPFNEHLTRFLKNISSARYLKFPKEKLLSQNKMIENGYSLDNCRKHIANMDKMNTEVFSSDLEFDLKVEKITNHQKIDKYFKDFKDLKEAKQAFDELPNYETLEKMDKSLIFPKMREFIGVLHSINEKLDDFAATIQIPLIDYEYRKIDQGFDPGCENNNTPNEFKTEKQVKIEHTRMLNHITYLMNCGFENNTASCAQQDRTSISAAIKQTTLVCAYYCINDFNKYYKKDLVRIFVNALATYLDEVEHLDEESYYSYMNHFIDERAWRLRGY